MKTKFTLLITLLLTFSVFGQKTFIDYDSDSKWFIGVNFGATYHNSDIETKVKTGFGLMLGHSLFMKKNSLLSLDVRLKYTRLQFEGFDSFKSVDVSQNPYLNGTLTAINYGNNGAVMNFSGDHHRVSLDLALHFNRLRERTGINLYLFGGAGFNSTQNKGDYQFNAGNDSLVNYYGEFDSYENLIDGENETLLPSAKGNNNSIVTEKREWSFMPSVGIGFGYQIGPKFALGIEHETTFTLNDIFDANETVGNQGTNDIYHYTSLWLKFHIGSRNKEIPPIDNDNTSSNIDNYDGEADKVNPPVVRFTNPYNSPYQTDDLSFNIEAEIQNVYNGANVSFKQNGISNNNFTYNPSTGDFESQVQLVAGNNVFELKGVNESGHDQATTIIVRNDEEVKAPPVVTFTNPNQSPQTTSSSIYHVTGNVFNVDNKSQVTFKLNGNVISDFGFTTTDYVFSKGINLQEGANIVTVRGVNDAGQDEKSVTIIYNKADAIAPPQVTFIAPSANPITVENSSYSIVASVMNVSGSSNITYKVNGQVNNSFNYNASSKLLQSNINLIEGANIVEITGTNQAGSDFASTTIIYREREALEPPYVTFTQPNQSPKTVYTNTTVVLAKVLNVASKNDIILKVNGIQTSNFSYSTSSKILTLNSSLGLGANIFEIVATNSAGQAQASTTIIYKKFDTYNPPQVTITNPTASPFNTQSNQHTVFANVLNVNGKQNITVKRNGTITTNFIYNTSSKILQFNMSLNEGNNVIEILASNNYGNATDTKTIVYTKPEAPKPPTVKITKPSTSPYTTYINSANVEAQLQNIESKQQIVVRINNVAISQNQFNWDGNSNKVTLQHGIILGNNVFSVTATNSYGSASDNVNIIFKKKDVVCDKPVVTIQTPTTTSTQNNTIILNAKVTNIQNQSQTQVKLNGILISGATFNNSTKILSQNILLAEGTNVIEVTANNECGSHSASKVIVYQPKEEPCYAPVVTAITPATNYSTDQQSIVFRASVQNATNQQITVSSNGQNVNYSYDQSTHILQMSLPLNEGNNSIRISAQNECGTSFHTWYVKRTVCTPPTINITQPNNNSGTSNPTVAISAIIENAVQSQIQLSVNGQLRNFVFNSNNNTLSSSQQLIEGANTIIIKANTTCGIVSKTVKVNYKKPYVANPPVVTIIYPSNSPHATSNQTSQVKATIQNVNSSNNVSFTLNGSNQSNFNFNASNGMFLATVSLQPGNNTISITGVNNDGQDTKSKVIVYNPPVVIDPPKVVFTSPRSSPHEEPNKYYTVKGYVMNVSNSSQVQFIVNNQSVSNFGATLNNGRIYFDYKVAFSSNNPSYTIKVIGTNQSGVDQESVIVKVKLDSNPMGSKGGSDDGGTNNSTIRNSGGNTRNIKVPNTNTTTPTNNTQQENKLNTPTRTTTPIKGKRGG